MKRFPGWLVSTACLGYVVVLTALTIAWFHREARMELRARGTDTDELFVIIPFRIWWFIPLLVPPIVFVAAWLWSRRSVGPH